MRPNPYHPLEHVNEQEKELYPLSDPLELKREEMKYEAEKEHQALDIYRPEAIDRAKHQSDWLRQMRTLVFKEGVHYGVIPGSEKPTLYKAGAECATSSLHLCPEFTDLGSERNFEKGFFAYRYRCDLYHAPTRIKLGSAIGSCNSKESKYRFRKAKRLCPECQKGEIGKSKFDPGWYCKDCKAKFQKNDEAITAQPLGQVENDKIWDVDNTIDKMAQKRALIAATLIVTGLSEHFTQDIEDLPDFGSNDEPRNITPPKIPYPDPATDPGEQTLDSDELESLIAATKTKQVSALTPAGDTAKALLGSVAPSKIPEGVRAEVQAFVEGGVKPDNQYLIDTLINMLSFLEVKEQFHDNINAAICYAFDVEAGQMNLEKLKKLHTPKQIERLKKAIEKINKTLLKQEGAA